MRALSREIINLTAILNLPKGTEHFMSDLHGEYEAFYHILNNCSGVIREKVDRLYGDTLSDEERKELCTLIYYPKEKLRLLRDEGVPDREWYTRTLNIMIGLARTLSSKYTRSKPIFSTSCCTRRRTRTTIRCTITRSSSTRSSKSARRTF